MEKHTVIDLLDLLADARGKVHLLKLAAEGLRNPDDRDAVSAAATEALASIEQATRVAGFEPVEDLDDAGPIVSYLRHATH